MRVNNFWVGQYLVLDRFGKFLLVRVLSCALAKTKVFILDEDLESWELNLMLHNLTDGLNLLRLHLEYIQKLERRILKIQGDNVRPLS